MSRRAALDKLEAEQRDRRRRIAGIVAILVMTAIAYGRAPGLGFIWDDESYVVNQPVLRDLNGLGRLWIPEVTPQYYPVVFTSFWIEHQLWGLDPAGYHVLNVMLHALNALLLWAVCRKVGLPGAASWLIAAIFAVHPVHVESVAWITERKNVLSGAFYLAAAWSYMHFQSIRDGDVRGKPPDEAWGWYGISLGLFVFALLSKSVTCSLPAALILIMLYQRRPIDLKRLAPLGPMFLLGALAAWNTAHIEREHVGAEGIEFALTFADRLLIASRALLFYPWKILWPHPLIFIYPRWTIDHGSLIAWWPLLAALAAGAGLIWLFAKGIRGPFLAIAFFAGTVLPALGFFNVYPHIFSFVADHFQYLASIGVIALAVMVAHRWLPDPKRLLRVAVVPLLVLVVLSWRHTGDFADLETLWTRTLAKNPDAWMPHNNLGAMRLRQAEQLMSRGEPADDVVAQAEQHARRAVELNPGHHTAHANLAEALRLQGRSVEALAEARLAAEQRPEWPGHHYSLGRLLELTAKPDEAEASYRAAIRLDPSLTAARLDLGRLLIARDVIDDAAAQYEAVLQRDPENFIALGTLANIRAGQARHAEAESLYDRAFAAAPRVQDKVQIAMREAVFLIQCPDPAVRDPEKAAIIAAQVVRNTRGELPNTIDVLAMALAAAGRFDEAIQAAEQAARRARDIGLTDLAAEIDGRLEHYRRRELPPQALPPGG